MKAALREIFETIILTILIFLLVRSVVQNFKVEGRSMEPTLESGQYLLINKAVYWRLDTEALRSAFAFQRDTANGHTNRPVYVFGPPQRGDIVVFRYPKDLSRDFIKRIIALPGETVEIRGGKVFVNGVALKEEYVRDNPSYVFEPTKVPPGHYFVLGDNRNNSSDSHVWGMVPEENVIGRAWVRYWPPDAWGMLPNEPLLARN
jgi:signal peptidase I